MNVVNLSIVDGAETLDSKSHSDFAESCEAVDCFTKVMLHAAPMRTYNTFCVSLMAWDRQE